MNPYYTPIQVYMDTMGMCGDIERYSILYRILLGAS